MAELIITRVEKKKGRFTPEGPAFKLLGVVFDTQLTMDSAVATLCDATSWNLRNLLRQQRYFETKSMVHLFKSRLLGYIEYRTAAIYHAPATALQRLDRIFDQFLRAAGISIEDALLHFGLAPLNARRDVAILGIIHRTVIGKGPPHFRRFFAPARTSNNPDGRLATNSHDRQLQTYRTGQFLDVAVHSILGALDVYNILPTYVFSADNVKDSQNHLQQILR